MYSTMETWVSCGEKGMGDICNVHLHLICIRGVSYTSTIHNITLPVIIQATVNNCSQTICSQISELQFEE